jgi:chorismate--pyruvate lyase
MSENPINKIKRLLAEKHQVKLQKPEFWKPFRLIQRITKATHIQKWLKTPNSLTAKLKALCPDLQVIVLSEAYEEPLLSEAQKLGIAPNQKIWIRCVILKGAGKHLIYARTLIPNLDAQNPWYELQALGNKPLGEVLFEMPNIQRSEFEFSANKLDYWPLLINAINSEEYADKTGFARRSLFHKKGAPLLLTEVFLPELTGQ